MDERRAPLKTPAWEASAGGEKERTSADIFGKNEVQRLIIHYLLRVRSTN